LKLLELSAAGAELSGYHIEAMIASIHARALKVEDTDWGAIVTLYDTLMTIRPSPIVALNRAIAVAQRRVPNADSKKSGRLRAATASPLIPSISRTSGSLSFAAEGSKPHASTFWRRLLEHEIHTNADFSINASARANETIGRLEYK
jgi:hypothetical protein